MRSACERYASRGIPPITCYRDATVTNRETRCVTAAKRVLFRRHRRTTMKINWGAIVVAALVHFGFGAFWFTAFGNAWKAGTRIPAEEMQAYMSHPNFWPYLISFLCSLGMALVISWVMGMACKFSLIRGILTGLMVGIVAFLDKTADTEFDILSLHDAHPPGLWRS